MRRVALGLWFAFALCALELLVTGLSERRLIASVWELEMGSVWLLPITFSASFSLALVGAESWTPEHVTTALSAGNLAAGAIDVALVGGSHPDPEALHAAGATWCIPEILPGATAGEALAIAATPPG